jgi:putative PIN family toxin of toxin-antitoxin system
VNARSQVFLDTNVWLSAIVFPGLCAELVLALDAAGHRLMTSELIRQETHEVLQRKFRRHAWAVQRFDSLWACATCVADVALPDDDADARLVCAAVEGGAQVFVTGDQRVLGWDPMGAMRIVSPRVAWTMLIAQDHRRG